MQINRDAISYLTCPDVLWRKDRLASYMGFYPFRYSAIDFTCTAYKQIQIEKIEIVCD